MTRKELANNLETFFQKSGHTEFWVYMAGETTLLLRQFYSTTFDLLFVFAFNFSPLNFQFRKNRLFKKSYNDLYEIFLDKLIYNHEAFRNIDNYVKRIFVSRKYFLPRVYYLNTFYRLESGWNTDSKAIFVSPFFSILWNLKRISNTTM